MKPAYIFDAFGTLFNLEIPTTKVDELTDGKGQQLLDIWRDKQLEYTWLRTLMQQYLPFNEVTKEALQFAMDHTGVEQQKLPDLLLPIYEKSNAYPDVKACLQRLQASDYTTAILSNGTNKMLKNGTENAQIATHLDFILSVDDIQVFKPDPRVYNYALNQLNRFEDEVVFVSSNQWDIAGAAAFGLPTIWLNRQGAIKQPILKENQKTISSLQELMPSLHFFESLH